MPSNTHLESFQAPVLDQYWWVERLLVKVMKSKQFCIYLLQSNQVKRTPQQGCQNKLATGAFHRLFWILRRLLRMLVGQFWAWYWRNKMEIAAYFLDGTSYSKTYWQPCTSVPKKIVRFSETYLQKEQPILQEICLKFLGKIFEETIVKLNGLI